MRRKSDDTRSATVSACPFVILPPPFGCPTVEFFLSHAFQKRDSCAVRQECRYHSEGCVRFDPSGPAVKSHGQTSQARVRSGRILLSGLSFVRVAEEKRARCI